jgi:FSR family fosmidomycin resistance protein-like MFS transporter
MMKKGETKFRSGEILSISFAHLLHDIYSSFLAPLLPLLIDKLSLSYSLAGSLSIFQRLPALFNPFVGMLAEKSRSQYFLIVAPAVTTVAMSLLGVAPGYIFLAVLLLTAGVSATFFHIPGPVMIRHLAGDRVGKGMSWFMLGGELARTVGPLIIVGAVNLFGLEGTWKLIPFGLFASFLLWVKLKDAPTTEIAGARSSEKNNISWGKVLKEHRGLFTNIAGIAFFRGAMKAALTLYLPVYLTRHGESLWMAGISLSVLQLSGAAGTWYAGTISDKIGRKKTLLIITVTAPLLMGLFLLTTGWLSLIVLGLTGAFLISSNSVMMAVVQDLDSKHLFFLNSIYMTIAFVVGSLMVLVVGAMADNFGLDLTYIFAALFAVPSVWFAWRLKEDRSAG